MADANARLEFLWKASHMLLAQCPSASSHYMSQFLSLASERDLRLHEDIQTKSCAGCGSIFVPGVNAQVRIEPVKETKTERERRKRNARKKAKIERNKAQKEGGASMGQDKLKEEKDNKGDNVNKKQKSRKEDSTKDTSSIAAPTDIPGDLDSKTIAPSETAKQRAIQAIQQKSAQKIIRITPYTEMAREEQQRQQQLKRRMTGQAVQGSVTKSDKRASQVLNHVYYSCKRCFRQTELDGTKEGYLNSKIKVSDAAQRAQQRKARKQHRLTQKEDAMVASTEATKGNPSTNNSAVSSPLVRNTDRMSNPASPVVQQGGTFSHAKRPGSPLPQPSQFSNVKKAKYSVSMPVSPVGGLSLAPSPASSAATSPASSPRIPPLGGGGSNKKKKKQNLATLLQNQKAKDQPDNNGSGASGGDSALASFLMGL
ncbi:ribonuclease P protein subunit RPR2 [Entomortierella parvispora]|uniref:Ribonuclease P protein subunit RPR2 n=1 Tax=Entomortierella parvispora TaxID=205924 RepID=A0A9P3H210_9FUNG|nr:ribonuclease P protein subunit RPR2 [Entomortierella parvispora]